MTEHQSVERISGRARVAFTCEHAAQTMPSGLAWPEADLRLVDTHWAYDLGAAELTRELARAAGAAAVLSNFSRLVVDPNRPEDSDTLFRQHAEGLPVLLNQDVSAQDRNHRLTKCYRPYHEAVDETLSAGPELAFSVHSFTPLYEGEPRTLEVGVLFDESEDEAVELTRVLRDAGFRTELNEPYSGKLGLMYCIDRHARTHGMPSLELEVRQDLAVDPAVRARLVKALTSYFAKG